LTATRRLHGLNDFASRKHFRAGDGEPGRGKNQHGKNGMDLVLSMPVGTVVLDPDTDEVLADLTEDGQELILIRGGRGGKGNRHFATATNRTPRFSQPGSRGEEKTLKLSLKFMAHIGLIGFPNAGKSTLLSRLTMARPKIDSYPFTTLEPNLGVLTFGDEGSVIIADIPGLIEGASRGHGLGHRFLKHIERTELLLILLDITFLPEHDILEDFHTLREEMGAYDPRLVRKPQMVLINKMDLYGPEHRKVENLIETLEKMGLKVLPISALTGQGLDELKKTLQENWVHGDMVSFSGFPK